MKIKYILIIALMAVPVISLAQIPFTFTGTVRGIQSGDVQIRVFDSRTLNSLQIGRTIKNIII